MLFAWDFSKGEVNGASVVDRRLTEYQSELNLMAIPYAYDLPFKDNKTSEVVDFRVWTIIKIFRGNASGALRRAA